MPAVQFAGTSRAISAASASPAAGSSSVWRAIAQACATVASRLSSRRSAVLALPLRCAEVDGDGDAAVAGGLDGFHLAHAHVDGKPAVLAAADLGLAGTGGAGRSSRRCAIPVQPLQRSQAVVGESGGAFNALSFIDDPRRDCSMDWILH
jgi:hypothetical protein